MPRKSVSLERTNEEIGKPSKQIQATVKSAKGPTDKDIIESTEQFSDASLEKKILIWEQDHYPQDQLKHILEDIRATLITLSKKGK